MLLWNFFCFPLCPNPGFPLRCLSASIFVMTSSLVILSKLNSLPSRSSFAPFQHFSHLSLLIFFFFSFFFLFLCVCVCVFRVSNLYSSIRIRPCTLQTKEHRLRATSLQHTGSWVGKCIRAG